MKLTVVETETITWMNLIKIKNSVILHEEQKIFFLSILKRFNTYRPYRTKNCEVFYFENCFVK